MKQKEMLERMESINAPQISSESRKKVLKIALLNAKRSAHFGILLILLPFVFAIANISKYELGVELGFITSFVEWIGSLDSVPVVNWIIRFLLLGGPAVAVLINLLSITHFYTDRDLNEFVISFKLKWLNIGIILFCGLILMIFLMYLTVENINHA